MSFADPALANLASRVQMKNASILLVEPNVQGQDVLSQIFLGFGATGTFRAGSYDDAKAAVQGAPLDLIVCEGSLVPGEPDGYDFVSWLRRSGLPNAFAPVIVISSHTSQRNVARARDCGAHIMIMKPLAPSVLLERILWIAQSNRTFVTCAQYAGPDRRFHNLGPPEGVGRRESDLSMEVGQATDPNMDQDQIDNILRPQKVAL